MDMFLRLPKSCGYLPQNRLGTHVSVSQKKPRPYGENFESSLSSPDLSLEPLVILGSVGHSISFPKYPLFGNSSPSQSTVWLSLPSHTGLCDKKEVWGISFKLTGVHFLALPLICPYLSGQVNFMFLRWRPSLGTGDHSICLSRLL